MSSLAIDAATAALTVKTGLSDIDSADTGYLQGRATTHWSYYLFIAGSIVGLIASIAGFILSASSVLGAAGYMIGSGGIFLCVSNGLAAFYVKKFGVLNTLEDYTQALAERLKILAPKILQLVQVNEDLEKINLGFEEIPKNWKEEISKGEQQLGQKIVELNLLTKKLEVAEKKIEALGTKLSTLQLEADEVSKAALEFSKENGFFGEKAAKLQESVGALNNENEKLTEHIKELDAQNDQTEEIAYALAKTNHALRDMYKMMTAMYLEEKDKMEGLKKEVGSLKTVVPQAGESSEKMEKLSTKYEQMIHHLQVKLENYKEYKLGYDLWQKWVLSHEYKSYLAWINQNK